MPRSMPGRLRPLRERSSPPTRTRHRTSVPSTFTTSSWMIPSLRKMVCPGRTVCGRRAKDTGTRCLSPTISSVVRQRRSSGRSSRGSWASCPMRIFGPGRSAMMATGRPAARAAARMFSMARWWPARSPWEKLRRATFMPARIICSMIAGDSDAGPIVHTILVLLAASVMGVVLLKVRLAEISGIWRAPAGDPEPPERGAGTGRVRGDPCRGRNGNRMCRHGGRSAPAGAYQSRVEDASAG